MKGLGDLFSGLSKNSATMGTALSSAMGTAATGIKTALGGVQAVLAGLAQDAARLGGALSTAFTAGTASIAGFVTAGLAASAMGQQLHFWMERLSLTIAGLFGPELRKMLDLLIAGTEWLRNLTDSQKELIVNLVKAAAAAMLVVRVMPLLFAGIGLVIGGIKLLVAAFLELDVVSGGILPIVGAVVTAVAALGGAILFGTEAGRGALSDLYEAFKPIMTIVMDLASTVMTAFKPLVEAVALVAKGFAQLLTVVLVPVLAAVQTLAHHFAGLMGVFSSVAGYVTSGLVAALTDVLELFTALLPAVAEVAGALMDALGPVLKIVGGMIGVLIKLFREFIASIRPLVTLIVDGLVRALSALAFVLTRVAAVLERIFRILGFSVPTTTTQTTEPPGNRSQLAPRLGGMEDPAAIYYRIAQASIAATAGRRSHEDEVEFQLRSINQNTGGTQAGVDRLRPAFAD